MMDNLTWILVADAAVARIFSAHKASLFKGDGHKLSLVSEHEHPDSRKTDSELVSDKQGKFFHTTFVDDTDPHRHEEEVFAMELAKKIAKARSENHFHELILITPPTFMGLINKHLPHEVSKMVNLRIEKDYTRCNANEIVKHLQEYL